MFLCIHIFIIKIDMLISVSCAPLFTWHIKVMLFSGYISRWLIFYSSADWIRWWLGLWRSLWYCVLLCTAHIISTMKIILLNSWITKFLQVGTTYLKIYSSKPHPHYCLQNIAQTTIILIICYSYMYMFIYVCKLDNNN